MTALVRHRFAILALFTFLAVVAAAGVWRFGLSQAIAQVAQRGEADLALASDRLTAQLQRYRELAVLMADRPELVALTRGAGDRDTAEQLLRAAADKTSALDLIYADRDGAVLASAQPDDPVYALLQEQPFFRRALHGALGAAHARSPRFDRRAFYFAAPTFGVDGRVIGVLTVIVDVEYVEWEWRGDRPAVLFVDDRGEVFISNRSEMLFWKRAEGQAGLTPPQGETPPFESRLMDGREIWQLDWGPYLPTQALHIVKPLPVIGMQGEAIVDIAPARRLAGLQAAVAAAVFLIFGLVLYQAMQRRRVLFEANLVLEERVAERTRELSETNTVLRHEISERQEAEAALKRAQAELVQAGKLSALGQMSAGISHELNQPLMAIQQFAENGALFMERGKPEKAAENLGRISKMAARMARIIRNLRSFARNENEPMGRVDIVAVIDTALELTETRLTKDRIKVHWKRPHHPVWVRGGEVRLGQVLVNLITNAADAMENSARRTLHLTVEEGARVTVHVSDTGPGIKEPEKIFDPFFSTKAVGAAEGVGLGLSISYGLVQSFGGNIRGMNTEEGARFSVELERWQEEQAA
ncbi:sensor histidine kinase [Shimia biformata]|uniref:sensor histidine kinase n=1 Tax=Shimia biformata TaxID=1294299 RepID=UPI00194E81FD|nr:ATP-binding protein [Shimia biformata]